MNDEAVKAIWDALSALMVRITKLEAYVSARRVDLAREHKYRLLNP